MDTKQAEKMESLTNFKKGVWFKYNWFITLLISTFKHSEVTYIFKDAKCLNNIKSLPLISGLNLSRLSNNPIQVHRWILSAARYKSVASSRNISLEAKWETFLTRTLSWMASLVAGWLDGSLYFSAYRVYFRREPSEFLWCYHV